MLASIFKQAIILLVCSVLIMHNEYFVGQTFAVDESARPDAHRLSGCGDKTEYRGNECTVQSANYDHQDVIAGEGYYSVLVLWSAAMISLFQIRRCVGTGVSCGWSTLFSAVAGLALLAGEVVQIAMYSDAKDKIEYRPDMLRKYKDACSGTGSGGASIPTEEGSIDGMSICDQYAALMGQKKNYEKAKDAADIKYMLQLAAAVAYGIAAAIEYYAAYQDNTSDSTLLAEAAAAQAAHAAAIAGCTIASGACEATCLPCQTGIASSIGIVTERMTSLNNPLPEPSFGLTLKLQTTSLSDTETVQAACQAAGVCAGAGNAYWALLQSRDLVLSCGKKTLTICDLASQTAPSGKSETLSSEIPRTVENEAPGFFLNLVKMFFDNDAHAGQSPSSSNIQSIITKSLGLAGAAVIVILALFKVSDKIADNLYATPLKRGLWNTLLAALAGGGAAYTKYGVIAKLEENIKKIDSIIKSADQTGASATSPDITVIPSGLSLIDATALDGAPIITNENPPLPCANGGDGKGKCHEIAPDMAKSLQALELGSVAGMSSSLATLGKELSGSRDISPKAMRSAAILANNAARVNKFLKDAKNLYNQSRGKVGLAPLAFEKVERDMLKSMYAQARATLKSQKTDAKSLLAGMQPQGLSEQDKKRFAEKVQALEASKKAGASSSTVAEDPFAAFALQNPAANPALSLEAETEINAGTEGEVPIDASLVIGSNDIETNPAVSLFQMLTSRYMKSAYPTLFEEQK